MKETIYRLGEYKIIESDTGQLMWEAHFGFGESQRGLCFRKGSILFFGLAESCRIGFLKGEFLDNLKKYSRWGKTKFYCTGVGVHHCKTGKSLSKEEMMLWTLSRRREEGIGVNRHAAKIFENGSAAGKVTENAVYRLQRYEITIIKNGQVISKTYSGSNSVTWGNCFILEDILFIGPQKNKPTNLNKKQFLESLRQLPTWDQTAYFSNKLSLHKCKPENEIKKVQKKLSYGTNATPKKGSSDKDKNEPVGKCPKDAYHITFASKLLVMLGSVTEFTKSRVEHNLLPYFRHIKSYSLKSSAVLYKSGITILKKIFSAIASLLYITTSLFILIAEYLEKHLKKWNDRKK